MEDLEQGVAKSTLDKLYNFHSKEKLLTAVIAYISSHLSTEQNDKDLRAMFTKLDTNGDGVLSRDEMISGFSNYFLNSQVDESEIDKIIT